MMHQSEESSIDDAISSQSTNTQPSSAGTTTLFPPTSKFHPDQKGLARRRRWLVVDYDGTCTEHDTTPLLPRLAALAAARRRRSSSSAGNRATNNAPEGSEATSNGRDEHEKDLERRLSQFQVLEDEFMKRFGEAKSNLLLSTNDDDAAEAEGPRTIHDVLDALDEPSTAVTHMVSASGVLDGLGHADASDMEGMLQLRGVSTSGNDEESVGEHKVETALGGESENTSNADSEAKVEVRLRQGCESTLARILLDNDAASDASDTGCRGWSLAVLSINWCPALIDASLVRPVLKRRRSLLAHVDAPCATEVPIWSNRVDGRGVVSLRVPGALAKRDRIAELRRAVSDGAATGSRSGMIVYVGDSSTDLAALLEADVGIVMGRSGSMAVLAEQWGIRIVPLQRRGEHGFGSEAGDDDGVSVWRRKKLLWQVESWQEIDEMLMELDDRWR